MPQTFQVLRCYKCEVFQVHPTKKSNQWKCKLCDEKQSIKRFFGLGTGKECRLHVQKLNGIRGELDGTHTESDTSDHGAVSDSPDNPGQDENMLFPIAKKSKWLDYVETETEKIPKTEEEQVSPDTIIHLGNAEVVLEMPIKRRKKCLTVTAKVENHSDIKCTTKRKNHTEQEYHTSKEKYLQPTISSSNINFMKSIEDNKANMRNCKTNPINNLQAPTIANNSKWAKFVETTQNNNDENDVAPITCTYNQSNSMFLLLENDDIDSVLDL